MSAEHSSHPAPAPVPAPAGRVVAHRAQRLAAPAGVLAAAVAAVSYVATVDPEQPGNYPTCPFLALTGLWCPGCGALRALHALSHGDLGTAIDRNVLTVAAVPLLAVIWVQWAARSVSGRARRGRGAPAALLWALLAGVLSFWLLRNLPFGSWLAP